MEKLNMQTTDVVMETQLIPKELLGMRTQGVRCAHFTSIFFVHSKLFIIFAHNILKPIMRRTYHSDLSQAIVQKVPPPPLPESPQAEGSWSHQRLRLTEMTFALLERVIDTAQRLGLQLNPREQSILIATLRGDSRRAIAQEMSITPQEVSRQADAALQQLNLFLSRLTDDEQQSQQHQQELAHQQKIYQQRISELEAQLVSAREPDNLRKALMASPIHKLPISRPLQSILLGAGHYALADILNTTREELQRLPNMTPPLLQELHQYLRSMGMMYIESNNK